MTVDGSQGQSEFLEGKEPLPLPGIKPQFLGCTYNGLCASESRSHRLSRTASVCHHQSQHTRCHLQINHNRDVTTTVLFAPDISASCNRRRRCTCRPCLPGRASWRHSSPPAH